MMVTKYLKRFWVMVSVLVFPSILQAATVVVTIPPLASAILPLLDEKDEIITLLPMGKSPHQFHLKPSHVMALESADLVISVGGGIDQWAQKAIENSSKPHIIMIDIKGMVLLPVRQKDHNDHGHSHASDDTGGSDPHIWLSSENMILLVEAIVENLNTIQPYQQLIDKKQQWIAQIHQQDAMISQQLQPVQKVPYLVLHDAFQYFEQRYVLNNVGSIQASSGNSASLKKIMEVHQLIQQQQVKCIFKEPQLSEKQINVLVGEADVKLGNLDSLGNPQQDYTTLLKNLANQYLECLK